MNAFVTICFVLMFVLPGANVIFAEYFADDFNRADNEDIGNDWVIMDEGELDMRIENNQLVISGAQGGRAWAKTGLLRNVTELGDFRSIHLRLQTTALSHPWVFVRNKPKGGYFEISAGPGWHWVYTNSDTGAWNGWLDPPNPIVLKAVNAIGGDEWVTVGVFQTEPGIFKATINDGVTLEGLENIPISIDPITEIAIGSSMDMGKVGEMAIDDVEINREEAEKAVKPMDKLAISWGEVKLDHF